MDCLLNEINNYPPHISAMEFFDVNLQLFPVVSIFFLLMIDTVIR